MLSAGQLFPDNDPQWKGASSDQFLIEAMRLMEERGYVIGNLDCTIIAEKPKLSPHKVGIGQWIAACWRRRDSCNLGNLGLHHQSEISYPHKVGWSSG